VDVKQYCALAKVSIVVLGSSGDEVEDGRGYAGGQGKR